MFLDTTLQQAAQNTLQTLGGSATLTNKSASYNAATGSESQTNCAEWAIYVTSEPISNAELYSQAVQKGDVWVYTAAGVLDSLGNVIVPAINMQLTYQGTTYRVVQIQSIGPGDAPVMYKMLCRR